MQMKWCSQVFSDPVSIISDLLSDMLLSLQPTLSQSFEDYISSSGLSPVAALVSLRQVAVERMWLALLCVWKLFSSVNYVVLLSCDWLRLCVC